MLHVAGQSVCQLLSIPHDREHRLLPFIDQARLLKKPGPRGVGRLDEPLGYAAPMRVMLTGATGFVGSHAAAALLASGCEVRALVRDPAKLERVFRGRGIAPPEAVRGDVTDAESVERALDGCEAVTNRGIRHLSGLTRMVSIELDDTNITNQAMRSSSSGPAIL